MKHITDNKSGCLPERELIRAYPKHDWLVIGHLTHAKPTSAQTQVHHFEQMMHALGYPNRVFGRRLHWLVRVGGPAEHIHLHFIIGNHQLTNGHKHSYTPDEVVSFVKNAWKAHGMCRVELYDSSRPGIEYVLRREDDRCHNDVVMSEALVAVIKKGQQVERDPVVADIVAHLRSQGVKAGFGDEISSVRRGVV